MALYVNSNISSLNAQRNLERSSKSLSQSLERLSSGMRINRAGDDAAGLAISTGLRSQITGLNQAVRNANDGLSLIGTAESAINSYTDILQRVRELAVQAANDTNSATNRGAINQETNQLLQELERISKTVEFNGTKLLDGSFTSKQLQVGAQANQTIAISTGNLQTTQIGMIAQKLSLNVPTTNPIAAGNLLINSIEVGPSLPDGVSFASSSGSAISIVNAINLHTADHGVVAEAQPTQITGPNVIPGGVIAGTPGSNITINNIPILVGALTVQANDANGALQNAINQKSGQTGVTASVDSTGHLILAAADGRNVTLTTTGTAAGLVGLAAPGADLTNATTGGQVLIKSAKDIVVTGTQPGYAGLVATTYSKDPTTSINYLSVATVAGANTAIGMVDNALEQINNIRAGLGAITNRLEHTIVNVQAISENLSASDSRIRDADFAAETASMSRNQILQQAGLAILAQSNTTTQGALKLLQG